MTRVAEPLVGCDALDDAGGIAYAAVGARVRRGRAVRVLFFAAGVAVGAVGVARGRIVVLVVQQAVHVALDVEVIVEVVGERVGVVRIANFAILLGRCVVREDGVAIGAARVHGWIVPRGVVRVRHGSWATPAEPNRAGWCPRPMMIVGATTTIISRLNRTPKQS